MSDDMTTMGRVLRERYALGRPPKPCPICGAARELFAVDQPKVWYRCPDEGEEVAHRVAGRCHADGGDPDVLALIDAYGVAADKAMRFDLDQAGIEQRERDAAELVDLRAKVAEASRRLAALSEAFAAVSDGRGHAAVKLVAADLDTCGFCGGTRVKHAPGCGLGPFVPHNEGGE